MMLQYFLCQGNGISSTIRTVEGERKTYSPNAIRMNQIIEKPKKILNKLFHNNIVVAIVITHRPFTLDLFRFLSLLFGLIYIASFIMDPWKSYYDAAVCLNI